MSFYSGWPIESRPRTSPAETSQELINIYAVYSSLGGGCLSTAERALEWPVNQFEGVNIIIASHPIASRWKGAALNFNKRLHLLLLCEHHHYLQDRRTHSETQFKGIRQVIAGCTYYICIVIVNMERIGLSIELLSRLLYFQASYNCSADLPGYRWWSVDGRDKRRRSSQAGPRCSADVSLLGSFSAGMDIFKRLFNISCYTYSSKWNPNHIWHVVINISHRSGVVEQMLSMRESRIFCDDGREPRHFKLQINVISRPPTIHPSIQCCTRKMAIVRSTESEFLIAIRRVEKLFRYAKFDQTLWNCH